MEATQTFRSPTPGGELGHQVAWKRSGPEVKLGPHSDFFDTVYYPSATSAPAARMAWVHGNHDTTGAPWAIDKLATLMD